MYQRILAPIDGSPTSVRGLREAVQLAKEHKAVLRLLHVVDESVIAMDPTAVMFWGNIIQQLRGGRQKILQEGQALAAAQDVDVQARMVEGVQRGAAAASHVERPKLVSERGCRFQRAELPQRVCASLRRFSGCARRWPQLRVHVVV